jgi:hypothetical protein
VPTHVLSVCGGLLHHPVRPAVGMAAPSHVHSVASRGIHVVVPAQASAMSPHTESMGCDRLAKQQRNFNTQFTKLRAQIPRGGGTLYISPRGSVNLATELPSLNHALIRVLKSATSEAAGWKRDLMPAERGSHCSEIHGTGSCTDTHGVK